VRLYFSLPVSVCPLAYFKNNVQISTDSLYIYLRPWLGAPLTAVQYVMYFWFSGWCRVSHNGVNGPELKNDTYVSSSLPSDRIGAKYAVSDYMLLFND